MSKGALRYGTAADMPPAMRALYEAARGGDVVITKGRQVGMTAMSNLLQAENAASGGTKQKRQNKYGNQITVVDGIRFDSKREAQYYRELLLRKAAGEVSYFLRQVPIHLPGGTRYVIDFLVFFVDPLRKPEYVDVKGRETQTFKIKRREVQHHYPISVVLA